MVRDLTPDLVADTWMPPTNTTEGLDAARDIRKEFPATGILVLSAHAEADTRWNYWPPRPADRLPAEEPRYGCGRVRRDAGAIVKGGSVMDPALVQELVSARRRNDPLAMLRPAEHEVLLKAGGGRSTTASPVVVTEGTVEKHIRSILAKLSLPETDDDHRRVLAVVTPKPAMSIRASTPRARAREGVRGVSRRARAGSFDPRSRPACARRTRARGCGASCGRSCTVSSGASTPADARVKALSDRRSSCK